MVRNVDRNIGHGRIELVLQDMRLVSSILLTLRYQWCFNYVYNYYPYVAVRVPDPSITCILNNNVLLYLLSFFVPNFMNSKSHSSSRSRDERRSIMPYRQADM